MTDNQLIAILITLISAGMTADGFTGIPIVQEAQPSQQGVNTEPTIFLRKMSDYWYGWKRASQVYDPVNENIVTTEKQRVETIFRFRALAIQSALTPDAPTASDLVNEVGCVLRSQQTIEYLATLDLGILRSIDVSNEFDLDDHDQFEAAPTFNLTLVHSRTRVTTVGAIDTSDLIVERV